MKTVKLQNHFLANMFNDEFVPSGCIVPHGNTEVTTTPILLLFYLEKVQLAQVLGSLLEHIEYRGSQHAFTLHGRFYLLVSTFIIKINMLSI